MRQSKRSWPRVSPYQDVHYSLISKLLFNFLFQVEKQSNKDDENCNRVEPRIPQLQSQHSNSKSGGRYSFKLLGNDVMRSPLHALYGVAIIVGVCGSLQSNSALE